MSSSRPEPRAAVLRFVTHALAPSALLTLAAVGLLHAWVEAELQVQLLLHAQPVDQTGVVAVGALPDSTNVDRLIAVAESFRWRWTLLIVSVGALTASLAGTLPEGSTRLPTTWQPAIGY